MSSEPVVSVVVTCYEQAAYVAEALDSVVAQDTDGWELIVTDDASTDGSPEVIRAWAGAGHDLPVTLVLHGENRGLTRTLNEVLPRCRGRYLAYLGGDDRWRPDKLGRLVAALDAAPDAAVAYSDARTITAEGHLIDPSFLAATAVVHPPEGRVFERLLEGNFVIASSAVYRTERVREVGGWDPDLPFEDWDLLLHLADRWPFAVDPEALVDYRVHDDSVTRSRFSLMLEGRLAVLEKWLGRDPAHDAVILPYLRFQSWRLYKVHPDRARPHLAVAHQGARDVTGRARYLIATRDWAQRCFDLVRRVWHLRLRLRPRGRPAYR